MKMLMGIFGQAALGLCEGACRTDSASCKTTEGGKLKEEHKMNTKLSMQSAC
jgi:hypothetical protein